MFLLILFLCFSWRKRNLQNQYYPRVMNLSKTWQRNRYSRQRVVNFELLTSSNIGSRSFHNEQFITEECIQKYEWQLWSFPSCNKMHEIDMKFISVIWINSGFWRDVWTVVEYDGKQKKVLKTLRYYHGFIHRNYERHRRESLAMERLNSSPYLVDLYAYCGNSAIFEYSEQGTLHEAIFSTSKETTKFVFNQKLEVAIQVAKAITHLHNFDVVHADISPSQFLFINGIYKLNDLNRCQFLRKRNSRYYNNSICGFYVSNNAGKLRSPEEYFYQEENEKIDVFSMGHIFYMLLTQQHPFHNFSFQEVYQKVKRGEKPFLTKELRNSLHPIDSTLRNAMEMCYVFDPKKRPSALDVLQYLMT